MARVVFEKRPTTERRDAGPSPMTSAIIPIVLGKQARAVEAAAALRSQGFLVPAIRYPAVARGKARLRLTLTAAHTAEDVAMLAGALSNLRTADRTSEPTPAESTSAHS